MKVREVWSPLKLAASGTCCPVGGSLGGFLCTTAGTLAISEGVDSGGNEIVEAFDVAEGSYYPLPFKMDRGGYATLSSAKGTFAMSAQ